jgi:hypothetical protein
MSELAANLDTETTMQVIIDIASATPMPGQGRFIHHLRRRRYLQAELVFRAALDEAREKFIRSGDPLLLQQLLQITPMLDRVRIRKRRNRDTVASPAVGNPSSCESAEAA